MPHKVTIIFCLSLLSLTSWGQLSLLRNYTPREYDSHPQVWDAIQDEYGVLYFAGTGDGGIIQYDGESWRSIPVDNNSTVFSLNIDANKTIYVGGKGDFGKLVRKDNGQMVYESLLHLVPVNDMPQFTGVWSVNIFGNTLFFRAARVLFKYNIGSPSDSIKVYSIPSKGGLVRDLFRFNGKFYCAGTKQLYEITENALIESELDQELPQSINGSYPLSEDTLLVQTLRKGLYKLASNGHAEKVDISTDFFDSNSTFDILPLPSGKWVINSRRKGVLTLNPDFSTLQQIDEERLLQDNKVYNMHVDNEHNVWMGLSNGITKLDGALDIRHWDKNNGLKGIVTSSMVDDDKVYVATFQSTFVLKGNQAEVIEGFPIGQYWIVKSMYVNNQKKVWVGGHDGLYEIINGKAHQLIKASHVLNVIASQKIRGRYYLASASGFVSFDISPKGVLVSKTHSHITESMSSLAEDINGNIWLGTDNNGVIHLKIEGDTSIATHYGEDKGLPHKRVTMTYLFEGKVLAASVNGLFEYNAETDRFEPFCEWGEQFCNGTRDSRLLLFDKKEGVWVAPDNTKKDANTIGYLKKELNSNYSWHDKALRRLPSISIMNISTDSQNRLWVAGNNGLYCYDPHLTEEDYSQTFFTLLRKVTIGKDSVIHWGNSGQHVKGLTDIKYAYNSVRFEYAALSFDDEEQNMYQYRLKGFEDEWSEWTHQAFKEFTNLYEGAYTFEVRARNLYGAESEVASYSFSIHPPLAREPLMFVGYALTSIAFIWLLLNWNARRLERDKEKLEGIVKKRTAEIHQKKEEITAQAENLRQMNEEIRAQAESLIEANHEVQSQKEEIEKSYGNIQILSEIGQQITSELDIETLNRKVYEQVNELMEAPAFGIGIYDEKAKRLEFPGFIENGEHLESCYDYFTETDKLSIWCVKNKQEIVINDVDVELSKFLGDEINTMNLKKQGAKPASIIYIPLLVEEEVVGVITVQSFQRNAYDDKELTLLRSLASYTAIAIDNAKAYEQVTSNNRRITDSIRYATTIQKAILPPKSKWEGLFKDYFIFFQPKDIVSGDFYWLEKSEESGAIFAAVVDCTGHGVPGGFMSMIGNNLLNEIIVQKGIEDTATVIEELDLALRRVLHQDENLNDDGMDVCLCKIVPQAGGGAKAEYCGVRRPLYVWYQSEGKIETIKGNRRNIGGHSRTNEPFSSVAFELAPKDVLYLSSDGLADLHSVENGKFTTTRMLQMLSQIAELPMDEQLAHIQRYTTSFQHGTEQRDDVTLVGIRC